MTRTHNLKSNFSMRLYINDRDLKSSVARPNKCPVSRALQRQGVVLGFGGIRVEYDGIYRGVHLVATHTDKTRQFLQDFYGGKDVSPTKLNVILPSSVLTTVKYAAEKRIVQNRKS